MKPRLPRGRFHRYLAVLLHAGQCLALEVTGVKVRGVGLHEVFYVFYFLPAFLSKLFLEGVLK